MNSINIIGRLTSDPTLRTSEKGNQIANFSVAVDDTGKRTDFFDCAAFTKTAETVSKYLKKGCKVGITGRLRIDKYEKFTDNRVTFTASKYRTGQGAIGLLFIFKKRNDSWKLIKSDMMWIS